MKIKMNKILLLSLVSVFVMGSLTSCFRKKQKSEPTSSKVFNTEAYDSIYCKGDWRMSVVQGEAYKVEIEAPKSYLKNIVCKVEDNQLKLIDNNNGQRNIDDLSLLSLYNNDLPIVKITTPKMSKVVSNGNTFFEIEKGWQGDSLSLIMKGNLSIDLSGVLVKDFYLETKGNCSIDAEGLSAENVFVSVLGNCSMDIYLKDAGKCQFEIMGNVSGDLTGTTRVKPICNFKGNGVCDDNTIRIK